MVQRQTEDLSHTLQLRPERHPDKGDRAGERHELFVVYREGNEEGEAFPQTKRTFAARQVVERGQLLFHACCKGRSSRRDEVLLASEDFLEGANSYAVILATGSRALFFVLTSRRVQFIKLTPMASACVHLYGGHRLTQLPGPNDCRLWKPV